MAGGLLFLILFVLGVVVVVVLVRRRSTGTKPRLLDGPPDSSWLSRPRPQEIWFADVPFQDGTGAKVRPCLVLRVHRSSVDVLKITSQDKRNRWDHLEIETSSWDPKATHNSFVDFSSALTVTDHDFVRRAGTVDDPTWRQITRRHAAGWTA
jgi:PemK-like, MazF-like toxin of type II toxin-antitoxin system